MFSIKRELTFEVHKKMSEITAYFLRNDKLGMYKVKSVDRNAGKVELVRGLNVWTTGEKISLSFSDKSTDEEILTEVNVVSSPILKTVFIDYGVNERHCARVRDLIKAMSDDERDFVKPDDNDQVSEQFAQSKQEAMERVFTKWAFRKEKKQAKISAKRAKLSAKEDKQAAKEAENNTENAVREKAETGDDI